MRVRDVVLGTAAVFVIGVVLYPVFVQPRKGRRLACLSNVKQLAIATLIYLDDTGGSLMQEDWHSALKPYVKSEVFFDCPQVKPPARFGFAFNVDLVGKRADRSPAEKTVLLFETDVLGRSVVANLAAFGTSRHPKGSTVAYLDGHAKIVRRDAKP